jgi:pimeloyl-ACP methyl ester carboxylesterase
VLGLVSNIEDIIMLNFKTAGVLVVATTIGIACSSNNSSSNAASEPSLDWAQCDSIQALECSELEVPVDYAQTDGEKITLALIRMPSTSENKLGALLLNPGGPGGSGVELVESLSEIDTIPDSILEAYDIVSFDPRGTGDSRAVDCSEFKDDDFEVYPADAADIEKLHSQNSGFANDCFTKYGSYIQQLGSLNVVRDMDEMRKAMGEEKLNFLGYSYGTRLAALYLQEYPTTSGRIVLDASMHPDSSIQRLSQEALPTMQSNLRSVIAQCDNIDSNCNVDELMSTLASRLVTLSDDLSASAQFEFSLLGDFLISSVEDPEFGQFAAETIYNYLISLDVAVLIQLSNQLEQLGFDQEGEESDSDTAFYAVACADDAARPSPSSLIDLISPFNQLSDIAAELQLAQATLCANWPEAVDPLPVIATSTAPLSLVIGGTSDAQTPLSWSEAMAPAIGGHYIRSEHIGHTVVFNGQSSCIDSIVEQFLLDGLTPTVTQCLATN